MFENKLNLQLFAEEGYTVSTDLAPAISVDLASRLASNIETLRSIISANELVPMSSGSVIKLYKTEVVKPSKKAAEGEVISRTQVKQVEAGTITLTLEKVLKSTTAEAITKVGRDLALNKTDEELIKSVQKAIKDSFFESLNKGTGTGTAGATLQSALANAWASITNVFDDVDASPIYFVNPNDVASYLGNASVTMQTSFGLSYIENFLGLGTAFVSPAVTQGSVIATAKENLLCAYIPADDSDVAATFGLVSDESGLVGITHSVGTERATIDTLAMYGVQFYAEDISKVIKVAISAA
jgi:hypothetical protein